jgi:hypothetical protein
MSRKVKTSWKSRSRTAACASSLAAETYSSAGTGVSSTCSALSVFSKTSAR